MSSYLEHFDLRRGQKDLGMVLLLRSPRREEQSAHFSEAVFLGWERGSAVFSLPEGLDWGPLQSREMSVCFRRQVLPAAPCFFSQGRRGRSKLVVDCRLRSLYDAMLD